MICRYTLLMGVVLLLIFLIKYCTKKRFYNMYSFSSAKLSSKQIHDEIIIKQDEWRWDNITDYNTKIWSKVCSKKIAQGTYTSSVINQHESKWCGCCYLVSVIQVIQDQINMAIGIASPHKHMKPFVELNLQIALDRYNEIRRINHPDWNACQGGNPLKLIEAIQDGSIPLKYSDSDGFAWYGHPTSQKHDVRSEIFLKKEEIILENIPEKIQISIFKYGPIVLGINANCVSKANKNGIIDTNIYGERNHAVTVIGWRTINGKKYWIARNSWGSKSAPKKSPEDLNCVQTDSNTCHIETVKWYGDRNLTGYFYIPFDYGPIKGTPSPWFFCCVTQLKY